MSKTCKNCKSVMPENSEFCNNCGQRLDNNSKIIEKKQIKKISILTIVLVLLIIVGFWKLGMNSIKGNWNYVDDFISTNVNIKNKKVHMIITHSTGELIIDAVMLKENSNKYTIPLDNSDFTLRVYDEFENEEEFKNFLKEITELLEEQFLSTEQRKQSNEMINSIKLIGNDLQISFNTSDVSSLVYSDIALYTFGIDLSDLKGKSFMLEQSKKEEIKLSKGLFESVELTLKK